jgi:hypothetical protein
MSANPATKGGAQGMQGSDLDNRSPSTISDPAATHRSNRLAVMRRLIERAANAAWMRDRREDMRRHAAAEARP